MKSGSNKFTFPVDRNFDENIKQPELVYPVPFADFWKEVKGKMNERSRSGKGVFIPVRTVKIRKWVYAVASLAVLVMAIFAVPSFFRGTATVTLLKGAVETRTADGSWRLASLGDRLPEGSQIRTGSSSETEIRLGDGSFARLDENGKLDLKQISRDSALRPVLFRLEQGSAVFCPKPGKAKTAFQVFTTMAKISASGKRFMVTVAAGGDTRVAAVEGPVLLEPVLQAPKKEMGESTTSQVLQPAVPVKLSDGLSAEIRSGSGVTMTGKISDRESRTAALSKDAPLVAVREPQIKAEFDSRPDRATVSINDRVLGTTPFSVLIRKNVPLSVTVAKSGFTPVTTNIVLTNDSSMSVRLSRFAGQPDFNITDGRSFPENLERFENLPATVLDKPAAFEDNFVFSVDGNLLRVYENKIPLKSVSLGRDNAILSGLLYYNGRIYAGSDNGTLFIYSPDADELKTIRDAGRMKAGMVPVLAGTNIVIATSDKGMEIYSDEGVLVRRLQQTAVSVPYYSSKKDILVYCAADGQVTAIGSSMEKRLWSVGWNQDKTAGSPAGNDECVFLVSRENGSVAALRLDSGKTAWKKILPEAAGTEPLLTADRNRLYITASSGLKTWFIALNASTGETEYQQEFPGQLLRPIAVEGKIVLISRKGKTALYDPAGRNMEYSSILR